MEKVEVLAVEEQVGVGKKIFLDKKEKELISKEIENLEKLSSAELVAVIAKKSSDYKYATLMISIVIVFLISFVLSITKEISTFSLVQYQLLALIGINILFEKFHSFALKFVPKKYKHYKASLYAKEQFRNLGLNKTKSKEVIMFFISIEERYVKIITDTKISQKIPNEFWEKVISQFSKDVNNEDFSTAYLNAIKSCNSILIEKFPANKNDENELPNDVIELI